MTERSNLPYPYSPRRRSHRARRLLYHPDRESRSPRQAMLSRIAGAAMARMRALEKALADAQKAAEQAAGEAETLKRQAAQAQTNLRDVRRRAERDKEESKKFAAQDFITSLIPTLDGLDHALMATEEHPDDAQGLAEGIRIICRQMDKALADHGIERVQALHEKFDPEVHEALGVEETDEFESDTVIQVLQNGYTLNGRLIRPARVRTSKKPQ